LDIKGGRYLSQYVKNLNESDLDYCVRLIQGKANNTYDIDYIELYRIITGNTYSYDEARKMFYGSKVLANVYTYGLNNSSKTRILHISDLHYPFNLSNDIYKQFKDRVDILIIDGDEEDCFSVSKFTKKYRLPFVDEMIGARQMLIDIINIINPKKVLFNYGNHNVRMINYFSDKIHEDLLSLMPETNLDFIVDIGFWKHNHEKKTKTFYEPLTKVFAESGIEIVYTKNWFCRVGKTIYCHPKAFKSGLLATVEKSYLYFLQIGEEPFDCIVMSHTHALGFAKYGKSFLYESGCLCKEPEYSQDGKFMRPQQNGIFYQVQDEQGNFLYNESKLVTI
jgi:predicted phosphodiesterase